MAQPKRYSFPKALGLIALVFMIFGGCSDSGTGVKKELEPLVGAWRAQELTLTNQANPSLTWDLVEIGATFSLSILATGQYTAVLTAFGQSNTETGNVEVSGNRVTISPVSPPGPSVDGTWQFIGEILHLDGQTEFDFNLDGTREQANVHFELERVGN
jgi:hypothetical protein